MKVLMKGNEALAEGAVRGGAYLFAGYPMTPQSEIMEYLSVRMPELGRIFRQTESETASIFTVYGARQAGMRTFTSSSGVGMSLMQEGISGMCAKSIPGVFANVQRCGPGLGFALEGQGDYLRDTRGGGNGDYRVLILAPNSVQEMMDFAYESFELAEKWKNPVEILSEGKIGQMVEPVELPEFKETKRVVDGMDGVPKKILLDHDDPEFGLKIAKKIEAMAEEEQRWESYLTEDAETIFTAYGIPSRTARGAVDKLRAEGERVGLLRVISAWPFPVKGFAQLPDTVKRILTIESCVTPQMAEDVLITAKKVMHLRDAEVYSLCSGPVAAKVGEIMQKYYQIKEDPQKEAISIIPNKAEPFNRAEL
ncbi:MAG: 3-methyl-2-oxobutanoate dehydrogenase subunit beta [Parasporobacterium sp.]|nr:3-methyl-2-oxobutanoate dehydrogenase subunit beta [Parasporobacterium sp.]